MNQQTKVSGLLKGFLSRKTYLIKIIDKYIRYNPYDFKIIDKKVREIYCKRY